MVNKPAPRKGKTAKTATKRKPRLTLAKLHDDADKRLKALEANQKRLTVENVCCMFAFHTCYDVAGNRYGGRPDLAYWFDTNDGDRLTFVLPDEGDGADWQRHKGDTLLDSGKVNNALEALSFILEWCTPQSQSLAFHTRLTAVEGALKAGAPAKPNLGIEVARAQRERADVIAAKREALDKAFHAHQASKPTAPEPTPEQRAAMCEAWGLDFHDPLHVRFNDGTCQVGHYLAYKKDIHTTTLADLESVLREHLPYTREWREAWLKGKGWVPDERWSPNSGKTFYRTPNAVHGLWVNIIDCGVSATPGGYKVAPDRAAFIAFVKEHTPATEPVEPDATPDARDARIAELESKPEAARKALT